MRAQVLWLSTHGIASVALTAPAFFSRLPLIGTVGGSAVGASTYHLTPLVCNLSASLVACIAAY